MADEDNQGSSRRTLLLIIGGVFGGIVLVGLGPVSYTHLTLPTT